MRMVALAGGDGVRPKTNNSLTWSCLHVCLRKEHLDTQICSIVAWQNNDFSLTCELNNLRYFHSNHTDALNLKTGKNNVVKFIKAFLHTRNKTRVVNSRQEIIFDCAFEWWITYRCNLEQLVYAFKKKEKHCSTIAAWISTELWLFLVLNKLYVKKYFEINFNGWRLKIKAV